MGTPPLTFNNWPWMTALDTITWISNKASRGKWTLILPNEKGILFNNQSNYVKTIELDIVQKRLHLFELNPSPISTLVDACAADDFWKHCDKRRKRAMSSLATMFSTLFSNYTYIYRAFLCVNPRWFQSRLLQNCWMWESDLSNRLCLLVVGLFNTVMGRDWWPQHALFSISS